MLMRDLQQRELLQAYALTPSPAPTIPAREPRR